MSKNKYLVLGLIIFTVAAFSINKINNANLLSDNTMLASTSPFSIDPKEQNVYVGQSVTFTIINNSAKTIIPNWSFSSSYDKYIDTTGCSSPSLTCTIKAISGPANLQITASYNNIYVSPAKLNISMPTYYIDPNEVNLDIGESYTFTSYIDTSTGAMLTKSTWTSEDDDYLDLSACGKKSSSCTVKTLDGDKTVTLKAEKDNSEAEAEINISSETYHASADDAAYEEELSEEMEERFYIEPLNIILTKGESYTFTSYTETGTSAPKEIKSEYWQLDSEYWDDVEEKGEIKDCNNSSKCTFYAGEEPGSSALFAWKDGDYATAYIEIVNAMVSPFTDTLPSWANDHIISLYNKGIVSGYTDGRYASEDPVTRGQYITMLYRTAQYAGFDTDTLLNGKDCNLYTDVKSDNYAYKPLCFAKYYNWLGNDFPGTEFKPDDYITRELAASINFNVALKTKFLNKISDVFGEILGRTPSTDELNSFYDYLISDIFHMYISLNDLMPDDKYMEAITLNDYYDVMNGSDSDGKLLFNPKNSLNRAEAAVTVWRFMWNIKNE